MGRLIDADALIEAMEKTEDEFERARTCPSWWTAFNVIKEQPTAYNVDKVVEELRELPTKAINRYKGGAFWDYEGTDYFIDKHKTIEIVKNGGVEHG